MTKSQILNKLPKEWSKTENNGFVHIRDINGKMRMRINPPDAKTKYHHVHLFNKNGLPLNKNQKVVSPSSPEANIPYKR